MRLCANVPCQHAIQTALGGYQSISLPDQVLPIHGPRNIRAMTYDQVEDLIYWIDLGGRRNDSSKISIKKAFSNGTEVDRILQHHSDAIFQPYDLDIDPLSRVLFWTCEATNTLNMTRLGGDHNEVGTIIKGPNATPRSLALHPMKR